MTKLQIKRGNKADLPILADAELGYCKDSKELYIGNGTSNDLITGNLNPDNLTKVVAITKGGTGAATVNEALANLGATNKKDFIAHTENNSNPHSVTKSQINLGNVDNTSDLKKPVSEAQQAAINAHYQQATGYTNTKIAELINGAPSTLDTLGEIASAMQKNENVVNALDQAIGSKASEADFEGHRTDKSNPHGVTKSQVGLGNVPNVSTNDQTPTYAGATALAELASGEKLSTAFGKLKLVTKNVISLVRLMGTTDIASIGNGTVTGALSTLNNNLPYASLYGTYSNIVLPYTATDYCRVLVSMVSTNDGYPEVSTLVNGMYIYAYQFNNKSGIRYINSVYLCAGDTLSVGINGGSVNVSAQVWHK